MFREFLAPRQAFYAETTLTTDKRSTLKRETGIVSGGIFNRL